MRYRSDLDLCLKNITLKIVSGLSFRSQTIISHKQFHITQKGKEKIGICGRTGAGKSSVCSLIPLLDRPESHSMG